MTIAELIEKLKKLPQDIEIYYPIPEYWEDNTEYRMLKNGPKELEVFAWMNDEGVEIFEEKQGRRKGFEENICTVSN